MSAAAKGSIDEAFAFIDSLNDDLAEADQPAAVVPNSALTPAADSGETQPSNSNQQHVAAIQQECLQTAPQSVCQEAASASQTAADNSTLDESVYDPFQPTSDHAVAANGRPAAAGAVAAAAEPIASSSATQTLPGRPKHLRMLMGPLHLHQITLRHFL
ncbi:hypothetical protein WJX73_006264 [Symbiochloris irregularis]|uniref:Uncharacterized protein n=1 Tax=Symbiochloris irregularis TaxID=706552 RepID=A0AAW1NVL9_9CHLO